MTNRSRLALGAFVLLSGSFAATVAADAAALPAGAAGSGPIGVAPARPAPRGPTRMMSSDAQLAAAVASPQRPAGDRARDRYRHPYESLAFWGVRPGLTMLDLQPGGGYWTEILAPYAAATGGVYVAGVADLADPKLSDGARKSRAAFEAKHADRRYGRIRYVGFGKSSGPLAPAGSLDLVLTSREIHNWIRGDYLDKALAACFAALKPGGVLAVEEHRADPQAQVPGPSNGYVAVRTVIEAASRAGFRFDAASEVNANSADIKDYPFGVWTLPPTRQSAPDGQPADPSFDHSRYDAIGESDRMTLRFRKPS